MDKKIENLGDKIGKVLLFGGVYSNLQALEKLKIISEELKIPPQNCICTGDIVGYCAQPEETVQLLKKWGAKSIAGNVEIQLKKGAEDCGCDFEKGSRCEGFSQQWYPFAQSQLSKSSLEFIQTLPDHITFNFAEKKVAVVHGSYSYVSDFIFKSTGWEHKKPSFEETNSDVIVAGHCGLPFHDMKKSRLWLNPGVIGMPANDGTPQVWFAILDDEDDTFNFYHYSFNYDHLLTSKLMRNGILPEAYAQTILTGIWDNTEILPNVEKRSQGFEIEL